MAQRLGVARQHAADLRLVEHADVRVGIGRAHQLGLVQAEDVAVVVEGAAALVLPGAQHRGDGERGMH